MDFYVSHVINIPIVQIEPSNEGEFEERPSTIDPEPTESDFIVGNFGSSDGEDNLDCDYEEGSGSDIETT